MTRAFDKEFAPAKESINWAKNAIQELKTEYMRFFQSNVTKVVTELDTKTGENVQKIVLTKDLPRSFRRKATEALSNTRHSFDQALFAARNITTGWSNKSVYFPWAQSPTDLARLLKSRGIDQRLWKTIADHEPYPRSKSHAGGDDLIRALAKIANSKHTIGLQIHGNVIRIIPPAFQAEFVKSFRLLRPKWDPVKNEIEIFRWIGDAEVHGKYQIQFDIVFDDPRLPEGVSMIGSLMMFSDKAEVVTESLQTKCIELMGG